jgi:hypothetical protein
MTTRSAFGLLAGIALCAALASCGDGSTAPVAEAGEPSEESTTTQAPITVASEADADLHLWISNQSFIDDPVGVTVEIDGVEVVRQEFAVEGQHNWVLFPIDLPPGMHVVTATSDTGVRMREKFRIPRQADRYAVVDYWNYDDPDGRHFTWRLQREPVAFM